MHEPPLTKSCTNIKQFLKQPLQLRTEQNSLFRCQIVHKLIVKQNSYFTCSNRQSRRDQWSSSQVTARGQRQLLRPYDQSPQAKSLQLRPSQSNFRCHNITEKSEYDIKKPNHRARGPPAHKHRTCGQRKAITKS